MPAPQSGPTATEADKLREGSVKPVLQPQQSVLRPPSEVFLCFAPEIFGLLSRKGERREGEKKHLIDLGQSCPLTPFQRVGGQERSCSEKVLEVAWTQTATWACWALESLPCVSDLDAPSA